MTEVEVSVEIEQKQRSGLTRLNPLQPGVASLNPLRFPDVFKGYGKAIQSCNGLKLQQYDLQKQVILLYWLIPVHKPFGVFSY